MERREQVIEGFRLSPQQKRVWQLQHDSQAYISQCSILIEGAFDSKALKEALKKIMRRHEILRTTLDWFPGLETPIQVVLEGQPLPLREVDLSHETPGNLELAISDTSREETRPFDLKHGQLARFCLSRLPASRHVLLISLHPLCGDSLTLKLLFKEVVRFYGAEVEGQEITDDPVQYLQFSEWQNELLEEDREEIEGEEQEVSRLDSELRLPLESNPAWGSGSSRHIFSPRYASLILDSRIAERIEAVCKIHQSSLSDFLLAAWQILLWRLSRREEIVTECLFDGRPFEDLHNALGLFARYVLVRSAFRTGIQFGEAIERATDSLQEAYASQKFLSREMAGGKVTERVNAIGFEYEEWPGTELAASAKFSYWAQFCCIDRFKLKLSGRRNVDGLSLEIQYDPSFFSEEGIGLILERYLTLIESAASGERLFIESLEIVGRSERERLLVEWNDTQRELSDNRWIFQLTADQARLRPESIAVIYSQERLSYRELESRANQLANYLRTLGVRPDCVVGLYLERSTEMMVGLLGILKAGGAYLPLEVGHPAERLGVMLEDAGARVIVTTANVKNSLPVGDHEVVALDEDWERIASYAEEAPDVEVNAENLAYVIYTSGSTGKPKGVMVRHGSVLNLRGGLKEAIYDGEGESLTVSLNAPLAFDASVKQVIQLGGGHQLYIVPEEYRVDGGALLSYLESNGVDVLDCTPSQLKLLMDAGMGKGAWAPRIVLVGGEAIDEQSWEEMSLNRNVKYYNVYGPTECTVDATACKVSEGREVAIGRPISNTRIYILDEEGRTAPTGVIGDIYIGGAGLARGYMGDAGLTAEKFAPDPFGRRGGERLYRSGDLGRHLEDGRIVFEGRRDDQVKVRGYRIELGEIAEILRSHPEVRTAVVTVREDQAGQKRLVGYAVGKRKGTVEGRPLRRLSNGMAIVEQNRNETEYLYEEIFKKKVYFKHGIGLPEGGCVFDVGANIGMFTLFVSRSRKRVRVYAFEPIKPIYETLRINAQLYGGAGIRLYQMGLGEKEKKEWYTYYRGYSMMSGESRYATVSEDIEVIKRYLRNEQGVESPEEFLKEANDILRQRFEEERYECEVRRLADVIREEKIEKIDLLKVDVQRAEMDVLRGLEEEDWGKIDQIVMEVHDQQGGKTEGRLAQITESLKAKGYEVVVEQDELLGGTDRYNLYAKREGRTKHAAELEWTEVNVDEPWEEITGENLRKYVRERAPDYMAPAAIIVMEELPLTRNGKVDRSALPGLEGVKREVDIEEWRHRSPYEELVSGIWEDVLKVESVRPEANFFEIGGHSLLATKVIAQIRDVFGVEIGVRSLFENPTVERLVSRIRKAITAGEKDEAPPLVRTEREGQGKVRLPLSFAQQRLWFIDQMDPSHAAYNCPGAVELRGRLDLEALESALNEIVRRHEALRTRFELEDGAPVQLVDAWEPRRLEVVDLTSFKKEEREAAASQIAKEQAEGAFDLSRGPLLRVKVLKLEKEIHVLLYTMHHIVSDGWSMEIMSKEVGALYQAYLSRTPSPLKELPIQYGDFAVWQRQWLQGEALEERLAYWRGRLAGMEGLELPTDHPRPAVQSYRGASQHFIIERELTQKLRELSQRECVTLFMTLLGGFDVLMSRYSGQRDVTLGTDIANRDRAEIEGLIGFFVNQLVLRVEVRAEERFRELLRRVREVCLEAFANQDVPFEKLVEALQPERDLSRSPLFQTKLIVQNVSREGPELGAISLDFRNGQAQTARVDLTVSITDIGRNLTGAVTYSQDLFEEATIERLVSHYLNVLRGIAGRGERAISELDLLSDQEREQILVEWNETGKPYSRDRYIRELFREQAESAPERVALVGEEERLSYGELNRRANQLGNYLQSLGVGPEVVVGICLERSVEMVVSLLGVLKAGGAYLPLDPKSPLERSGFMLEDAGVGVVLTQRSLEKGLPAFWGRTVLMDVEWERIGEEGESEPESVIDEENLAYVIYTSGSTGRPKGVMVKHRGLSNYLCWSRESYLPEQGSVVSSPLWFDATVTSLITPLISGGAVRLLGEHLEVDGLWRELRGGGACGLIKITPSHLEVLGERLLSEGAGSSAGLYVIGGEALSRSTVDELRRIQPGVRLVNEYGPTETVVGCVVYEIPEEYGEGKTVPIGRPIANTQIYLLDEHGQPAPVGVRGELYIGGAGVARGYLGRPELTAERFVACPFGVEGGERMYKTGDVGRYLGDGTIEYIGRNDFQVKVRGYRVELGEIEAKMLEYPGVREAVVVAREDGRGDRRLVAYWSPASGVRIEAGELREHLSRVAPEYMTPAAYVELESMPLTSNGKLDRNALPAPERDAANRVAGDAARTPIEEMLVGILEDVLQVDRVGIYDSFFEIGGHSLLAIQVVSRVRNVFGVELGVKSIFDETSVEGLAKKIEEAIRIGMKEQAPPLIKVSRREKLPLSFAQQRLWFLDRLMPNNSLYNIPGRVRLEGHLDLVVLERVINEIVRRHEILRTRIKVEKGEPVQVIEEWELRSLDVDDLTSLTEEEREAAVQKFAKEVAEKGFDLNQGPLFRVKALKLEVNEHVVLFTMHHIVSDGLSMGILIKELGILYQAYSKGEESPLEELPIQYADFAVWQREWLQGGALEAKLEYWRNQLAGVETLRFPTDYPRSTVESFRGAEQTFLLDEELTLALRALSRREGVTLFMTLLAAFQTLLYGFTGQKDITVGTPVANRNRLELEGLIGFFINTMVLRTLLSSHISFRELLRQVRETALAAYAHDQAPFEKLVVELSPKRVVGQNPLFQVWFFLDQTLSSNDQVLPGLTISSVKGSPSPAKLDLALTMSAYDRHIAGRFTYAADLFDPETIGALVKRFQSLLLAVVLNPDGKLLDLLLADLSENQELMEASARFIDKMQSDFIF